MVIKAYRRTPLYPCAGAHFAKLLAFWHRLVETGVFVHDTGAFRLHIDPAQAIDAKIYYTGSWEPLAVETISRLLVQDGVAIDVGANIGYLTLVMASRVGTGGRVIAFEPSSWNYTRLRANVELNDMRQIHTVQSALSDEVRRCERTAVPYGYRLDGEIEAKEEAIDLTTLDHYLSEHPVARLDFIKSDTDGMEGKVFRGAVGTLRRFKPVILFELHPNGLTQNESSGEGVLAMLEGVGYRFYHEGSLAPLENRDAVIQELRRTNRYVNIVAMTHERTASAGLHPAKDARLRSTNRAMAERLRKLTGSISVSATSMPNRVSRKPTSCVSSSESITPVCTSGVSGSSVSALAIRSSV